MKKEEGLCDEKRMGKVEEEDVKEEQAGGGREHM